MKLHKFVFAIVLFAFFNVSAQPTNVRITSNNKDQSEVTIAIDPSDSNHLISAWNDFRSNLFEPGYAFSTNGGNNWSDNILPNHGSYNYGFDPSLAIDNNGNVFYCYIGSSGSLGPVFVSKTTNDGSSWSHTQVSSSNSDQDKPLMAVDNTGSTYDGRIYVSWTDFSAGSKIKFSYSSNHGSSFSPEITLATIGQNPGSNAYLKPINTTPGNPTSVFLQGSMPAVGPNGEVYVVWMDVNTNSSSNSYFKIRKSTDGGASFGSTISINNNPFTWNRNQWGRLDYLNLPSLAVDPNNGYVYITYEDGNTPRIKFIRSTDGGSSWNSAITIGNLSEQGEIFPWVACDSEGKVAVTFMHRKSNGNVDCYVVESYDHGASFRTPVKVTDTSSNPNNSTWTHHYQGMVLDDSGNDYVVWTDYRNGNADPYFAKLNTVPEAPQNLVPSIVNTAKNPRIDWDANIETDLDKYEVWKNKDNGGWNLLATTSNTYYIDNTESGVDFAQFSNNVEILYKLKAVDLGNNKSGFSGTVTFNQKGGGFEKIASNGLNDQAPETFTLAQNFPNPFNPTTTFTFAMPESAPVRLSIFDLNGRQVAELINEELPAGRYEIPFDASNLASGVYLYRLAAGQSFTQTRKMMLIK